MFIRQRAKDYSLYPHIDRNLLADFQREPYLDTKNLRFDSLQNAIEDVPDFADFLTFSVLADRQTNTIVGERQVSMTSLFRRNRQHVKALCYTQGITPDVARFALANLDKFLASEPISLSDELRWWPIPKTSGRFVALYFTSETMPNAPQPSMVYWQKRFQWYNLALASFWQNRDQQLLTVGDALAYFELPLSEKLLRVSPVYWWAVGVPDAWLPSEISEAKGAWRLRVTYKAKRVLNPQPLRKNQLLLDVSINSDILTRSTVAALRGTFQKEVSIQ